MSSAAASLTDSFDPADWYDPPHHREGLHRVQEAVTTAPIAHDPAGVRTLSDAADQLDLTEIRVPAGLGEIGQMQPTAETISAAQFMAETATDAVIILHGHEIVHERYEGSNTNETRHIVMSVSKSFGGMLAGALVDAGLLSVDDPVTKYVPELAGGAYDGATLQQVLDMTAQPHYSMAYLDPTSEVHGGDRAAGWRPLNPGEQPGNRRYLAQVQGHDVHGSGFYYCSGTTDVLAWTLERAAGTPYPQLMSERLWARMGAEADAYVTVDALGDAYACAGMGMRLRDLARFGRLILDHGAYNGNQVIPAGWIETTRKGGDYETADAPGRPGGTYKNQWWIPRDQHPSFYAVGIFGQYLWLDPARDVVIAKFSSEPIPSPRDDWHSAGFDAIAEAAAGSVTRTG